jgi:hypothetical protein
MKITHHARILFVPVSFSITRRSQATDIISSPIPAMTVILDREVDVLVVFVHKISTPKPAEIAQTKKSICEIRVATSSLPTA